MLQKFIVYGLSFMVLILSTIYYLPYTSPIYAATPIPCALDPNTFKSNPADKTRYEEYVKKYGECPAGLDQLEQMVGNIISVIVSLGFIAMLFLIVTAGIKYLTSGGEPKALQSAHQTLVWAILGIFLMAVAWVLLQLIQGFTGIEVTVFNIKTLCKDASGGLSFCK
ncbi:hypothetical protein A2871_04205 [Candidatus Daviesbacteria bacterium RIFCSPHIGHO2_01_FULL_41_23]|uniref:Uncharacterized protein n=1 Tax=Candidatus Daviesbacteria bacterium RIFCSPHIGHO2_01_FULL_41_23 TaxID=1797764 RepID=A0A1F5IQM2_9BACT|nr:MAG: hypothetical protein A2871_04205 [Candidatus Daviesbacteria bacterium RIFCSPHIGHO2_01_FULL_41_23]